MRLLENVSDTLVSSYFPSQDEINQRFSATDISSENPYWDSKPKVVSLSDVCIKVNKLDIQNKKSSYKSHFIRKQSSECHEHYAVGYYSTH